MEEEKRQHGIWQLQLTMTQAITSESSHCSQLHTVTSLLPLLYF